MSTVYVLNKDGKPLMPTARCGHVRHLLKEQKARVVTSKPFTIQLLYETDDVVQPLYLGIDPGRTNIGVAVVKADGTAVFTAHLETRNKEIPKLMKKRKDSRRARRTNGRRCRRQRRAKANGTISKKCVKQHHPRVPYGTHFCTHGECSASNRPKQPDHVCEALLRARYGEPGRNHAADALELQPTPCKS